MPEKTREELLELLKQCNPRSRKTIMRVIEGKVDRDNIAFVKETCDFLEADGTVRSTELVSSRTCTSGHMTDDKTRLVAVADCCGAVTCSAEGCSRTCSCGRTLCARHVYRLASRDHCLRCLPFAVLKMIVLGTGQEATKK